MPTGIAVLRERCNGEERDMKGKSLKSGENVRGKRSAHASMSEDGFLGRGDYNIVRRWLKVDRWNSSPSPFPSKIGREGWLNQEEGEENERKPVRMNKRGRN